MGLNDELIKIQKHDQMSQISIINYNKSTTPSKEFDKLGKNIFS